MRIENNPDQCLGFGTLLGVILNLSATQRRFGPIYFAYINRSLIEMSIESVAEVVYKKKRRSALSRYWATMGFIFQIVRDIDPKLRVTIDTFTLLGLLYSTKLVCGLILTAFNGFRVHFWSRIWKIDLKKRYGEWAVITGATDGIGLEYARAFAKRGLSLVLVARNEVKLTRVKTELSALTNVVTVVADLNSDEPTLYERISMEIDGNNRDIGILFNNAGVMYDSPNRFLDQPEDKVWQHVRVNMAAVLMMTRAVLPGMIRRRRGLIINMSSIAAYKPLPLMGVYSASKVCPLKSLKCSLDFKSLLVRFSSNGSRRLLR